ncbi:MAG: flagellar biosynthesis protein FliQ [Acidithiobacillus sp.]|jgi:flagellar biosynthetic protein FliQ|uniref:flagellar biosynthesis protein FliQ n=1 Tax=Acidithiobacillus sp. TaxID=1872118 RepID=UPI003D00CCF5
MTPESIISVGQQAIWVTLLLSAPLLGIALVVGLLVSIFQAATQLNEMTLSFVPKILAMGFILVVAGPWMLHLLMDFTVRLFTDIPHLLNE